jgi:heme-degrading monooxygenase HmoA
MSNMSNESVVKKEESLQMTRNDFFRALLTVTCVLSAFALFSLMSHQSLSSTRSLSPATAPTADARPAKKAIARIWHGRVLTSRADEYYPYLKEAGIDKITAIEGNLGAQVMRRNNGKETEFIVISYWESREAIKKFAGEDIEKTHFLPKDPDYLLELEPNVRHFEVLLDERK